MIDHILIPSANASTGSMAWDRVTDPVELYRCILQRNKGQLLKALDSPFATGPLAAFIGRDSSGQTREQILDDTIPADFITHVDDSTEMGNFIRALQRPTDKTTGAPIHELNYNLNDKTYREIFSKANEKTSSSPSGIHYGHYIAACQDDLLTTVNATFTRVPFLHGFPLERWSSSIQCMLQKNIYHI